MPVRVLLLTQWFDPEPTLKGLVFARELLKQGFEVEVLTGFPNYPGGKIYPGYRNTWVRHELIDGVHITRVPLYPSHDHSAIRRILNYVSFAAASLCYALFAAKKPHIIYAYHPPLTTGLTAALIRLFRRVPVVYDIQDMWPDTLRATGMIKSARALRAVDAVCRWVYRRVDHVVVLSPGFRNLLMQRGVPDSKIDVIYNWADEKSLNQAGAALPTGFPVTADFKIMFAGNMGKAQALDTVLDAASILQNRGSRVRWILIGGGLESGALQRRATALGLQNVTFLPAVPMSGIGVILRAADALFVHLRKDPLFRITVPSKTQAYMAIGKPLVMAVDGDAADLVRQSDGGVVVESENPVELANAVDQLASLDQDKLRNMGRNAQRYYHDHLSLEAGARKFGAIFYRLAKR